MAGENIPRGGIFEGHVVFGPMNYWGPASQEVSMVPRRIGVQARPGFNRVGFSPRSPRYVPPSSTGCCGYGAAEQPTPSTMDALYRAEAIGRGQGIFEQSVMSCPTADGSVQPDRGGIFDGPNFGQECVYTDRVRAVIPQAKPPEVPIQTNAPQQVAVSFGRGPDGIGRYFRR